VVAEANSEAQEERRKACWQEWILR